LEAHEDSNDAVSGERRAKDSDREVRQEGLSASATRLGVSNSFPVPYFDTDIEEHSSSSTDFSCLHGIEHLLGQIQHTL
jgi:hypothetical protein